MLTITQQQALAAALRGDSTWVAVQTITVSTTAPGSPALNDLWLEI